MLRSFIISPSASANIIENIANTGSASEILIAYSGDGLGGSSVSKILL